MMPLTKFRSLQHRLDDLKQNVARLPSQYRLGDVSVLTVHEYDGVLDAIIKEYPEIRVALPDHIHLAGVTSGISYNEFETLIDETITILDIMSPS